MKPSTPLILANQAINQMKFLFGRQFSMVEMWISGLFTIIIYEILT